MLKGTPLIQVTLHIAVFHFHHSLNPDWNQYRGPHFCHTVGGSGPMLFGFYYLLGSDIDFKNSQKWINYSNQLILLNVVRHS